MRYVSMIVLGVALSAGAARAATPTATTNPNTNNNNEWRNRLVALDCDFGRHDDRDRGHDDWRGGVDLDDQRCEAQATFNFLDRDDRRSGGSTASSTRDIFDANASTLPGNLNNEWNNGRRMDLLAVSCNNILFSAAQASVSQERDRIILKSFLGNAALVVNEDQLERALRFERSDRDDHDRNRGDRDGDDRRNDRDRDRDNNRIFARLFVPNHGSAEGSCKVKRARVRHFDGHDDGNFSTQLN